MIQTINKPSILAYDIETSPCQGWFWTSGKQVVNACQIREPGKIICISYRFLDWEEGRVENLSWDENQNDRDMVLEFQKIAEAADLIIGHNGDGFDQKWLNARLAYHNAPGTLSHKLSEDTLKQCRQAFRLPSFRLDFLCKYFGIPGKLSTSSSLWEEVVFNNDRESLKYMMSYCDNDVIILSQLVERLFSYVKHKINVSTFTGTRDICPRCGDANRRKRGYTYTAQAKKQMWECLGCHHRYPDTVNLLAGQGKFSTMGR